MSNNIQCPNCGASNVQKSSALYAQGVRVSEGQSTGMFVTSRGTFGVGKAKHVSRSSSLATELNAPPGGVPVRSVMAFLVGIGFMFLVAVTGGGLILSLLILLIALGVAFYLTAPTDEEDAEWRRWERQWYCKRCGYVFLEDGPHLTAPKRRLSPERAEVIGSQVSRVGTTRSRRSYADRVLNPPQRATSLTTRDATALEAIRSQATADGSFDPEMMGCDLGIIARLASLRLISYDEKADRFAVQNDRKNGPRRGWWQRTFG